MSGLLKVLERCAHARRESGSASRAPDQGRIRRTGVAGVARAGRGRRPSRAARGRGCGSRRWAQTKQNSKQRGLPRLQRNRRCKHCKRMPWTRTGDRCFHHGRQHRALNHRARDRRRARLSRDDPVIGPSTWLSRRAGSARSRTWQPRPGLAAAGRRVPRAESAF